MLDLDSAIQNHSEWKMKFRTAISQHETMDAAMIARDDCCELGKWLHGDGKEKFGKLISYTNCFSSHAVFHIEAGKVAQAINTKKYAEAWNMIDNGTSYANASSVVAGDIMRLKEETR